jgi:hypothetical protein
LCHEIALKIDGSKTVKRPKFAHVPAPLAYAACDRAQRRATRLISGSFRQLPAGGAGNRLGHPAISIPAAESKAIRL